MGYGDFRVSTNISDSLERIKSMKFVKKNEEEDLVSLHRAAFLGDMNTVESLVSQENYPLEDKCDGGFTPLHLAVQEGYLDVALSLLENGANIKACTELKVGMIHLAAFGGHLDILKYLITRGADVNETSSQGTTALHIAAAVGHLPIVQYLLEHNADVNKIDNNGCAALTLAHDLSIIECLLGHGADVNVGGSGGGSTALQRAADEGNLDVVKYLLDHGADVNKKRADGTTALYFSVQNGHLDVTKYLLDNKADVNQQKKDGLTALHFSAWKGHLDVIKCLLDHKADVNELGKAGVTALHLSALQGRLDVTKYLIDHKADINKQTIKEGATALYYSARHGHFDVTKYLIDHKADVNKEDKKGATALHMSSEYGHLGITKYLIDHKADVNKEDEKGSTALHLSTQYGHLDVTKYLIDHKADVNREDEEGATALHMSSGYGHLGITKYLIDHKADANKEDEKGATALHLSTQYGHLAVTKYLLDHKADVNKQSAYGHTALHLSAKKGYLDITECLLNHVAKSTITKSYGRIVIDQEVKSFINQSDVRGYTALHLATHHGYTGVIEMLVSHGADLNIQSNLGQTCLHQAIILCYVPFLWRDVKSTVAISRISTDVQRTLSPDRALVLYFLDQGASPHLDDVFGKTPLQYVWDSGFKQMISRWPAFRTSRPRYEEVQIRLPRHGIKARILSSVAQDKREIYVKELRKVPAELILKGNEVIIASGLQMKSDLQFSGPVIVTMAHCAKFSKPERAEILLYTRQGSGQFVATASSAEGVSRCVVRETDLDLHTEDLTECWIVAVTERDFGGKRLVCTPYIPTSLRWNKSDCVKLLVVDDLRLKERKIEGYKKACIGQKLLVGWRKGDLTIRYLENGEEMETKKVKEKTFHSLVTHQLQFLLKSREKREKRVDAMFSLEQNTDIKEIGFALHFEGFPFDKKNIDDRGGELSVPSCGFTLTIPPGALKEGRSEEITLEVLTEIPDCIHLQDDEIIVSYGYACHPSGIQFQQPVSLVIPHCAVLGDPVKAEIALYSWDDLSKGVMRYSHKEINCKVSEVAFSLVLDHFCGGLLTLLEGLFVEGKRMSCMPYLPKTMPFSRKPVLDVRLVNKPTGKQWASILGL